MNAAINKTYGSPSVIKIADINKPKPGARDIIIRVKYSSVNRTDIGFLRAKPFVTRLFTGILRPKYDTLGCEFSGIVEEIGSDVDEFKVRDRVFGFDDQNFGGYAEYKVISVDKAVAKIPHGISLEQAAASTEGAHYALFYIYAFPKKKDLKIFINGATGAIGSAALQIIKSMGYHTEASSTTKDKKIIEKLGAEKVIDWQQYSITENASMCDVYFDAVGKSSYKEARIILNPGGLYMSSELGKFGQNPILSLFNPIQRIFTGTNIGFPVPKTRKMEINLIAKYLASGQYSPLIDRMYDMIDIQKAFEYVETGQKVGNVLIKIN